jgi:hypothetical protein
MMVTNRSLLRILVAFALMVVPAAANAQLSSNQAQVALSAHTFTESLSLSTTTAGVNFNISPVGMSDGDQPIDVQLNYQLSQGPNPRPIQLYFYFAQPQALGSSAGGSIPSLRVFGSVGGLPYVAFDQPTPFSGPTGLLVPTSGSGTGSIHTDLNLRIDGSGLPLQAGINYTGTMFIQAQAL